MFVVGVVGVIFSQFLALNIVHCPKVHLTHFKVQWLKVYFVWMGLNQCVIRIAFSTSCDTQSYQSHKIWDLWDFSQSCVALSKIHCCLFSPKPARPLFPIPPPPNQINTIFPLTTLLITSDNLVEDFFEYCLSTMISLRSDWKRPPENQQWKFGKV